MSKIKYYGGVALGVALSLLVINQALKAFFPAGRSWLGLNG